MKKHVQAAPGGPCLVAGKIHEFKQLFTASLIDPQMAIPATRETLNCDEFPQGKVENIFYCVICLGLCFREDPSGEELNEDKR